MDKFKVGEYIRFEDGKIRKIVGIDKDNHLVVDVHLDAENWLTFNEEDNIVKHSPNIIDLIEVGDYINESKLLSIDYAEDKNGDCDKLHFYYSFEDAEKDVNEYYEELVIKSIVTKEQFDRIKYEV